MTEKLEKNDSTPNGTIIPRTKMLSVLPIFPRRRQISRSKWKMCRRLQKKGRAYNIIALVGKNSMCIGKLFSRQ